MAFDQNFIPKDLRPLNVTRIIAEEPFILPATTTSRTTERFPPNSACEVGDSGELPLFYPASVSDSGLVGIGYTNAASGAPTWCVPPGVPTGHPTMNPAIGFNYSPNFGNRIGVGNAAYLSSSVMATGPFHAPNLGSGVGGNNVDKSGNDAPNGLGCSGNRVTENASNQVGRIPPTGTASSPTTDQRPAGNRANKASDEGRNDSGPGKNVKILCSFSGKILPRPSDGMLRYVGGQTRIISFKRDVSFNELMQKMVDTYGQPVIIKYQLPDEDLDALVSVSCPDDLENMMDEYEKLIERSSDGSAKLRVFLFCASEIDPSGVVLFGDLQVSGQKYVEAVNGFSDRISGGSTRKQSIRSATSIRNSDFSATEALESSIADQGDTSGAPTTSMLSIRGDVAASHDTGEKLVIGEPDASAVPLSTPVAPIHSSPFQNEVELERSVPITLSHQQFGLEQSGMDIPPPVPYLQRPFVDSRQEVMNHADYVQLPPQMRFLNPQFLGNPGSIFIQQQFRDNTPALASYQVIPVVQMTMTPSSSHFGVAPNIMQPLMQPHQNRVDQFNDECKSGIRIVQLPAENSCNSDQVQVPSAVVGGNYGWVQVPPQEHAIFSDGLSPQQKVMIPKKIQRLEDCYKCQNTLGHAHSDPVIQDQCDGGAGPISDSIPSYHSLPMEDNLKGQATNAVMVTAPLKEGVNEQVIGTRPRVISKVEPPLGVPFTDTTGLSQNLESQPEGDRDLIQKIDGLGHPRNSIVQDSNGRAGDKQSPSDGLSGTTPLSCQDKVVRHYLVPVENLVNQDALVSKPVNNDIPPVGATAIQTSECVVQEPPKKYTNELAGYVSKAETVDNWVTQGPLRPIDGRMDSLRIHNDDIYVIDDCCKLSVNKPSGNNEFDHNNQHVIEKEVLLDNNFGRSKLVFDANPNKMTDVLPCSCTKISCGHNSRLEECNEVAQPLVWGIPGSNSQSRSGSHHKDDATPSSISPSVRSGDVQNSSNALFSSQDPWNIHHGTYFPTGRNKDTLKKETFPSKDHFGENLLGNYEEQNLEAHLDDGCHQPFKRKLTLEHGWFAKAEDQIKQELQAVAEGVAASVLHSSTPSNPDLHGRDVYSHADIEDVDVQNNLVDIQCKAKVQDIKSKPPEKANFGFPISDGLGGLQIIKNCDLEELRELGSGTFGTVYHGKWRGTDVAIKRINDRCFAGKSSEQERMRGDFWNEAIKLADLHHPNVVAFYGVVLDGPGGSVATVTEYMANGSLRNALQKNERNLDQRKRLLIAMDVAFGMEYLHGKNIVHFDLKSDNLLVNLRDPHRPICKVGDLGLSQVKRQTLISGGVRGTLPWMAPELLNGSSSLVSEKVDVFSFGIVMWELLTGEEPYADLHYGAIIGGIVSNTLRPPVPESCDPEWRSLTERCWSSEPSGRPSFTEIANELRSMAAKIPPKGQNQQQQPASLQSQGQN